MQVFFVKFESLIIIKSSYSDVTVRLFIYKIYVLEIYLFLFKLQGEHKEWQFSIIYDFPA
jgi:hypothetical protein